ncbi:MAG: hypothetical protein ACE5L7_02315 [Candidatus Aminicenantales bacterium]
MKNVLIFSIILILAVSPALAADPLQKIPSKGNKQLAGISLIATGATVFVCSMVLTLLDQKTQHGRFHGYDVTYQDYKTEYLVGDAVGVLLFSAGAFLYFDVTKNIKVNAEVRKKEAVIKLRFSF